jgi:glutathione gamma-glutamylcysteinyltransferase
VSFSSKEGRIVFREALDSGGLNCYFPLSEQFLTQSEPAYCSLSSLAMVMNALNHDPKKVWKSPWRWVTEEMLQCESKTICCPTLAKVLESGLDFDEFERLARCQGIMVESTRAQFDHDTNSECSGGVSVFRKLIESICSSESADTFLVSNYSRKELGQTGSGHFSPIGTFSLSLF